MSSELVYRTLVPHGPIHRRTEHDDSDQRLNLRKRSLSFPRDATRTRGLQRPALISSFSGSIDRVLFCFPMWAVEDKALARGYLSFAKSSQRSPGLSHTRRAGYAGPWSSVSSKLLGS